MARRVLFCTTLLLAILLAAAVVCSPLLSRHFLADLKLLALYSQDATVRRTSLAAAIGLAVTAFIFFKPNPSAS